MLCWHCQFYVYNKYETRNLVDILCNLGYGESYDEVRLFLDNARDTPSHMEQLSNLGEEAFMLCVFDNADWNRRNDGNDEMTVE